MALSVADIVAADRGGLKLIKLSVLKHGVMPRISMKALAELDEVESPKRRDVRRVCLKASSIVFVIDDPLSAQELRETVVVICGLLGTYATHFLRTVRLEFAEESTTLDREAARILFDQSFPEEVRVEIDFSRYDDLSSGDWLDVVNEMAANGELMNCKLVLKDSVWEKRDNVLQQK